MGETEQEPRQRYVDDAGTCWASRCQRPATHLLTTRSRAIESFPQGLLVDAAYCWEDAIHFAGAAVALYGGTFVSLDEIGTGDSDG